ncbi:hypothetical protein ABZP36_033346 [Zizania latifolia]
MPRSGRAGGGSTGEQARARGGGREVAWRIRLPAGLNPAPGWRRKTPQPRRVLLVVIAFAYHWLESHRIFAVAAHSNGSAPRVLDVLLACSPSFPWRRRQDSLELLGRLPLLLRRWL